MKGQLRHGSRHLRGGLEPARVALADRGKPHRQLFVRHRPGRRDVANLIQRLANGGHGDVGADAGLQHERAHAAPQVEPGAHTVGVALGLAQVEVDAAHELPAKDGVEHQQRGIVWRRARRAHVADAQLGLRGARPRHHTKRRLRPRRRRRQSGGTVNGHRGRSGPPFTECARRQVQQLFSRPIADDDQRCAGRRKQRRMQEPRFIDGRRRQRRGRAQSEMTVRMRVVQRARERAFRHRPGMVLHLPQALEAQVANPVEVVRAEIWRRHNLLHQSQSGLGKPIQCRERHDHGVGADFEIQVAANARDPVRQLERRLAAAALVQQPRGDRHEAMTVLRIRRCPAGHQQHDRDHRHRAMRHRT